MIQRLYPSRLIIDLSEVPSIGSSVSTLMVSTLRITRSGSGMQVICGLNKMFESVFEIARLRDGMFTITNTLLEVRNLYTRREGERFRPEGMSCNLEKYVIFL